MGGTGDSSTLLTIPERSRREQSRGVREAEQRLSLGTPLLPARRPEALSRRAGGRGEEGGRTLWRSFGAEFFNEL